MRLDSLGEPYGGGGQECDGEVRLRCQGGCGGLEVRLLCKGKATECQHTAMEVL